MSRSTDLLAELDAAICRAQTPEARAWRERMNWSRAAALMGLGGGVQRVAFSSGHTYTPTGRGVGTPAILIPAWEGPAPGQSADELLDLVAWLPSTGQMISRLGLVDLVGNWAVHIAGRCMGENRPLRVFSNPARWAAAATWDGPESRGAHGILIVSWAGIRSALWHLIGNTEFIADDLETGRRLRDALRPPALPSARILVAADAAGMAA